MMVAFSLTAAQLAGIKATPFPFASLTAAENIARVPKALTIVKPAGTAYTIGTDARLEVRDEAGNRLFSVRAEGLLDSAAAQKRYIPASGGAVAAGSSIFTLAFVGSASAISGAGPTVRFQFIFDEIPMA